LLEFLKRDQVKDPFGGDESFEGESRFAGKGPKIALAVSGVMFVILAGGIAAIVLTGKAPPPPMMGSLSDVEVVEDTAPSPVMAPAQVTPATPAAKDAVASTDRSADRRPWLNAPGSSDKQLADAKAPLMTPPPAKSAAIAAPAPAAAAPAPAVAAPTPQTAPAAPKAQIPQPAPVQAAANAEAPAPADKDKEIAVALPFGPAPGAPSHFDLPTGADTGPAVAGGKPRLAEPANPPTDRAAIAAPPPRFANLATIKLDQSKVTPASAKVAIVVEDLGLSQLATETAINKLPAAVTLAFSPYARDLKKWLDKAKAGGHEVLIEVPMESKEFPAEDPGPLGLLTTADTKENQDHLDAILKIAGPAVGVLESGGSKFRESDAIAQVFAKLKEKNLFYVQAQPGVRVGEATVPIAVADVVLDERPFRAAVDARLDYAERLAKYQGSAVAAMSAKPVAFERLVLWIEQAQKKGIALTPISQVTTAASAAAEIPPAVQPKAGAAGAQPNRNAPVAKAPAKAKS
jgi:uncharacterized protein